MGWGEWLFSEAKLYIPIKEWDLEGTVTLSGQSWPQGG